MAGNINLLPTEEKQAESFNTAEKRILYGSLALIAVTGVITFVLLGFFSVLASARSDLISQIEASAGEINSFKQNEELVVVVKDKAGDAEEIINSKIDNNKIFGRLSELVPQGVYFSDIKFNGNSVSVTGKARTSADAAGLVSSLASEKGAELFSDVNMNSLASDSNGNYQFTLTMNIVSSIPKTDI